MPWDVLKTKGSTMTSSYPKSISWIVISAGGLALFLTFASWVLVSQPIGSTVSWYFYGVENTRKVDLSISPVKDTNFQFSRNPGEVNKNVPADEETSNSFTGTLVSHNSQQSDKDDTSESHAKIPLSSNDQTISQEDEEGKQKSTVLETSGIEKQMVPSDHSSGDSVEMVDRNSPIQSQLQDPSVTTKQVPAHSPGLTHEEGVRTNDSSSTVKDNVDLGKPVLKDSSNKSYSVDLTSNDTSIHPSNSTAEELPPSLLEKPIDKSRNDSIASGCNLYHGNWIHDSLGPLYTNNSCPIITQMQNCQGNGRPDKDYENWRWKPSHCDLPRFDPKKFLELMRGKTLAFIGDSVCRNQMESLLCILWQVEVPKNRGNRKMQRYYFASSSVMIVRIWSSWLVNLTTEALDFAPAGVDKLHLDVPDQKLMEFIPSFDVIVVSSGHWFAKQSVYVLNNEIVGGQLWWPDKSRPMKVNNIDAFGISVDTFLTALVTHPTYKGLTIVRTYSPDHYEGGAWNTGGSCTGKIKPLAPGELVENGFTNIMHEKQVGGFNSAIKKATNKSKLKLMDITEVFSYRHDGHPGPYRSPDPNKITKRGPDGRPPPQDCLHWCMPGPVDTWNELVLEIIRSEYEDGKSL